MMIRKKDLKEDINILQNDANNLYKRISEIEKNQEIEIGEGKEPTGLSFGGLVYIKITMKEILLELLKQLDLNIVEIKNKPIARSFEIKPIKQKKGK